MLIAAADAGGLSSRILTAGDQAASTAEAPNPILPVLPEILWSVGCFLVLFFVMRYAVYPKLAAGMEARAKSVGDAHAEAEKLRRDAQAEVAQYESALAGIRQEAAGRIDAARQVLDAERQSRIGAVNARIAEQRAAALAEAEAARAAVADQIAGAAAEVAAAAAAKVLGRDVDVAAARTAVDETMQAGVR